MKEFYQKIMENSLFAGIAEADIGALLACVQGRVQRYPKNGIVLLAGSPVKTIGIVLRGQVQILREDMEGKQDLLTELQEGALFAEVFACAGIDKSPVTVMAKSPATVLHLNYRKVVTSCASSCVFHQRLIANMLKHVAEKNLQLNQKLAILSRRTTRQRLLLFFAGYGCKEFTIAFNREELAAYLCVERSAMCAELSKMQAEGLVAYTSNHFIIKQA